MKRQRGGMRTSKTIARGLALAGVLLVARSAHAQASSSSSASGSGGQVGVQVGDREDIVEPAIATLIPPTEHTAVVTTAAFAHPNVTIATATTTYAATTTATTLAHPTTSSSARSSSPPVAAESNSTVPTLPTVASAAVVAQPTTAPLATSGFAATTEPLVTSTAPVTTKPVVTTIAPVTTKPVATSTAPVTTKPVVSTSAPATTKPPVSTTAAAPTNPPVSTTAAVTTKPPTLTPSPTTTKPPVSTTSPPATTKPLASTEPTVKPTLPVSERSAATTSSSSAAGSTTASADSEGSVDDGSSDADDEEAELSQGTLESAEITNSSSGTPVPVVTIEELKLSNQSDNSATLRTPAATTRGNWEHMLLAFAVAMTVASAIVLFACSVFSSKRKHVEEVKESMPRNHDFTPDTSQPAPPTCIDPDCLPPWKPMCVDKSHSTISDSTNSQRDDSFMGKKPWSTNGSGRVSRVSESSSCLDLTGQQSDRGGGNNRSFLRMFTAWRASSSNEQDSVRSNTAMLASSRAAEAEAAAEEASGSEHLHQIDI